MVVVRLDNFELGSSAVVVIRSRPVILVAVVNLLIHTSEFVWLEYTDFDPQSSKKGEAHSTFSDHMAGLRGSCFMSGDRW